jgi:hypothetical protein
MTIPPRDPEHWLYRFTPEEWLRAAVGELAAALEGPGQRKVVASARRAAGMALNAVLAGAPNEAWGRSYMDHLRALAADPLAPAALREACAALVQAPLDGPRLVALGGGADASAGGAARVVVEWCVERVEGRAGAPEA